MKEPVGDVLSPVDGTPPELSVGHGDLLPRPDGPGGGEGEPVVRPVEGLGAGTAVVREYRHAGVEHPHYSTLAVLTAWAYTRLKRSRCFSPVNDILVCWLPELCRH